MVLVRPSADHIRRDQLCGANLILAHLNEAPGLLDGASYGVDEYVDQLTARFVMP
jgi:hypothetical protein